MNNTRESIAAALFALLQGAKVGGSSPFTTMTRSARVWSDTGPDQMPALLLIHTGEQATQQGPFGLTRWKMNFDCLIYLRRDAGPDATFDTQLNNILDAIDSVMQSTPDQGQRQTLGGLVTHAWIEGEILIDPGILDQQAAILIPIKVLTGI